MKYEEKLIGELVKPLSEDNKFENLVSSDEINRRIEILKNQNFYKGCSYFDSVKSKSVDSRFEDCVNQIKKYGWPDFNYMLYGMDVKSKEECGKYVNGWEFVCRRNYLNFGNKNNNSTCLLRNKILFRNICKSNWLKDASEHSLY